MVAWIKASVVSGGRGQISIINEILLIFKLSPFVHQLFTGAVSGSHQQLGDMMLILLLSELSMDS